MALSASTHGSQTTKPFWEIQIEKGNYSFILFIYICIFKWKKILILYISRGAKRAVMSFVLNKSNASRHVLLLISVSYSLFTLRSHGPTNEQCFVYIPLKFVWYCVWVIYCCSPSSMFHTTLNFGMTKFHIEFLQ